MMNVEAARLKAARQHSTRVANQDRRRINMAYIHLHDALDELLQVTEKDNILAVPAKALRFHPNDALLQKGETIDDCEGDHKLWTKEGTVFKAHKVEVGTSNGVMTEITGGIAAGTEVLADFNISGGGMPEQGQQGGNPFMPRPRNRNANSNNKSGGNAAPPRQ